MSRTAVFTSFCLGCLILSGALVFAAWRGLDDSSAGESLALLDLEERLDTMDEMVRELAEQVEEAEWSGTPVRRERTGDRPPAASDTTEEPSGPSDDADAGDGEQQRPDIARLVARLDTLDRRLQALEEDPVERGYTYLASSSAELRSRGIRALESIAENDPEARRAIRNMLMDSDEGVVRRALDTLADIGDEEALPQVRELLADPESNVREEALETIGRLGSSEDAADVAPLLADAEAEVREEAAEVLGDLESPQTAPALIGALEDSEDDVRREAIDSLGQIGAKEAVPALRELYAENPERDRVRLARALHSLGDDGPFKKEVTRLSESALNDQDASSRRRAVRTLRWFARDEAQETFQQALEDPNERVRREARRALRGDRDRGRRG